MTFFSLPYEKVSLIKKLGVSFLPGPRCSFVPDGREDPDPSPPSPGLAPVCTLSHSQPRAHTLSVQNYVRTSSGKLVCGAHSYCINIYKTFQWTLQMSKCLLFRLLCQYLLSISFMGIQQGSCLSRSNVTGDVNPACTSEQVEVF